MKMGWDGMGQERGTSAVVESEMKDEGKGLNGPLCPRGRREARRKTSRERHQTSSVLRRKATRFLASCQEKRVYYSWTVCFSARRVVQVLRHRAVVATERRHGHGVQSSPRVEARLLLARSLAASLHHPEVCSSQGPGRGLCTDCQPTFLTAPSKSE